MNFRESQERELRHIGLLRSWPYRPLRRAAVFPTLPCAALFVFEPVFVLLSVRHGDAFEGLGLLPL
jgi:hypothetical protein